MSRNELLELLEQRRRAFRKLSFEEQHKIDEERFLPTEEMYSYLDQYLKYGYFCDENKFGRPLTYEA